MKLTITTLSDDIFTLDVSDDLELENFKALCEFESGISAREIVIVYNGIPLLDEKKILKDYGIKDGDVLLLQHMHLRQTASPSNTPAALPTPPPIDFSEIEVPNQSESNPNRDPDDPAYIRDMFLSNAHELALLKENNPRLAEALLSGDIDRFSSVLKEQQHQHAEKERRRIRLMNADPFDPEAQRHIAEEIRMENIESNMETAMEYAPESFGQVVMLYINCSVNGHPVKAFVDSGAQTTLMSQSCAERCNIMRLVDQRWAGIAKGVGTQKIIGRVHLGQIQIGSDFLSSSFSILEEQPMDMLLGLDMLKRHQCCIDLKRNLLVIGTTGTETPFLNEGELPECARLNRQLSGPDQTIQESEDRELAEALMRSSEDSSTTSICTGSSTALTNHSSSSSSTSGVWSEASGSSNPSTGSLNESQPKVPESDIARIIAMGFSREQVLEELQRNQGDINQTIAALFVKSLHF